MNPVEWLYENLNCFESKLSDNELVSAIKCYNINTCQPWSLY